MTSISSTSRFFNNFFQKHPLEVFCKKMVFLTISQNLQENICARVSFLMKLQAEAFSCEFREIFQNPFFQNTFGRLLLFFFWKFNFIVTLLASFFIHHKFWSNERIFFNLNFKGNESRYMGLFVFSGSIRKLFSIDCVNIHLFSIFFSIDFCPV